MTRTSAITCLLAAGALILAGCARRDNAKRLPTATITLAGRSILVELARTPQQRQRGLMFRESLDRDAGMLFIFPRDQELNFYMKNTYIPLSIAFIRADGAIARIEDMRPLSLDTHTSGEPVRYALEMNQGWFKRNNVNPGDRVGISGDLAIW